MVGQDWFVDVGFKTIIEVVNQSDIDDAVVNGKIVDDPAHGDDAALLLPLPLGC